DRERASPSETLAMGLDAAAVRLDQRFHEREAEPEAAAVTLEGTVDLLEHLENALELLGRNPDPVVAHDDHDVPFAELHAEPHVAAGGRVLRGVAQQVREHLREADRIGVELDPLLRELDHELVPGLVEERTRLLERALDDRIERDPALAQLESALRDARDFEQIVDEPRELLDLPLHDLERDRDRPRIVRRRLQQIDAAAQRRERISELVRER